MHVVSCFFTFLSRASASSPVPAPGSAQELGYRDPVNPTGGPPLSRCDGFKTRLNYDRCDHNSADRFCVKVLDTDKKTPLPWGKYNDFWEAAGYKGLAKERKWNNRIIENQGDSWCVNMYHMVGIITRVRCNNLHLQCSASDVKYIMAAYDHFFVEDGMDYAWKCLVNTCKFEAFYNEVEDLWGMEYGEQPYTTSYLRQKPFRRSTRMPPMWNNSEIRSREWGPISTSYDPSIMHGDAYDVMDPEVAASLTVTPDWNPPEGRSFALEELPLENEDEDDEDGSSAPTDEQDLEYIEPDEIIPPDAEIPTDGDGMARAMHRRKVALWHGPVMKPCKQFRWLGFSIQRHGCSVRSLAPLRGLSEVGLSTLAAPLCGLLAGGGVTFVVLFFRVYTSPVVEDPLLNT